MTRPSLTDYAFATAIGAWCLAVIAADRVFPQDTRVALTRNARKEPK